MSCHSFLLVFDCVSFPFCLSRREGRLGDGRAAQRRETRESRARRGEARRGGRGARPSHPTSSGDHRTGRKQQHGRVTPLLDSHWSPCLTDGSRPLGTAAWHRVPTRHLVSSGLASPASHPHRGPSSAFRRAAPAPASNTHHPPPPTTWCVPLPPSPLARSLVLVAVHWRSSLFAVGVASACRRPSSSVRSHVGATRSARQMQRQRCRPSTPWRQSCGRHSRSPIWCCSAPPSWRSGSRPRRKSQRQNW